MAALLVTVLSSAFAHTSADVPSSSARLSVVSPIADASPLLEPHEDSLIQADASHAKTNVRQPQPAAWFGSFHTGESTYSHDGLFDKLNANPELQVRDGWDPRGGSSDARHVEGEDFFVESRSGGPKEAWQSFYPALGKSVAGNEVDTGKWFEDSGDKLQQEYVSASALGGGGANYLKNIPASWFDDSVNQHDGFGRHKFPSPGSPRNYVEWQEKSVNTTMTCKDAGCTAKIELMAPFNPKTEMAKNCKLSVFFHPTDFDDQYSGEAVEWVSVNNKQVVSQCRPMQWGCNKTAQRPLLPCVNDLLIDELMPANGSLAISSKINMVVDECPVNGSLLSAVPMVTCLVSPKPKVTEPPKPVMRSMLENQGGCETKMPLQCTTRGCAAEISIPVNKSCSMLGPCKLSIDVQQTDYDNKEGTPELIEYIKVDGKVVNKSLKPGENPCKSTWHGKPIASANKTFSALKDHVLANITSNVLIEGKISQYVDECASNGYLFDAIATVTCSASAASAAKASAGKGKKTSFLQNAEVAATASPRKKLRGSTE